MNKRNLRWLVAGIAIAFVAAAVASAVRRSQPCDEAAADATGIERETEEPQPAAR